MSIRCSAKAAAIAGILGLGMATPAVAESLLGIERVAANAATLTAQAQIEAVAQAPGDIVDVASAVDDFSTLVAAIEAAELVDALKADGPFTVFAPTNDAFAALPAGVVDALLLPENQDLLVDVLTYHVVPGELMSSDLSTGMVETLGGESVTVTADNDMVLVEEVDVIAVDVPATNGVIHVIDEVLVPSAVATELESRLAAEEEMMVEEAPMVEEPMMEEPAPAEPVRGLW